MTRKLFKSSGINAKWPGRLARLKRRTSTPPTEDDLWSSRFRLDLWYDQTCFSTYLDPSITRETAIRLIAFAATHGLPCALHWPKHAHSIKHNRKSHT